MPKSQSNPASLTKPLPAAHRAAFAADRWFGAALPPAQREALLDAAELVHLRRGAMVWRQGDPVHADGNGGGAFFGLAAGTIKMSTLRQDGREAILALLEPGNWFGELSLIDGSPRSHDATALAALDLYVVPFERFAQQMRDAVFARAVAGLLAGRVRGLYGLMEDATLRDLRARVVRRLLALARGDTSPDSAPRTRVTLPQEALAMMLGITRQTLSKELNALAQEGLIRLGYGRIELLAMAALQRVGGAG